MLAVSDARPVESVGSAGSAWPALDELVDCVVDTRRRAAAAQAAEARLLAAAVDLVADRVELLRQEAQQQGRARVRSSEADLPLREVALELAMALRVSDRGVQRRMSEAFLLRERFPTTLKVWEDGGIDAAHAWAISRTGMLLRTPDDRARFEALALEAARTESPTRMTAAVKVIAATIDPDAFTDATDRAYETRSVRLFDLDDGMARLIADLPAPLAYAIHDALTSRACHVLDHPEGAADGAAASGGGEGDADSGDGGDNDGQSVVTGTARTTSDIGNADTDPASCGGAICVQEKDHRTLAQVRADILSDLLLTATPTTTATGAGLDTVTAQIQLTIPALTLAGAPDAGPAILTGYGPIQPALARRLTGLAPGWDRVFTAPIAGIPVAVDRYRPSAGLRRYLSARDERCRTPGCTRPAHRCDQDHTTAAAIGGATAHDNLAHLCRRHHTLKHHTTWRVRHLGGGTLQWTSPTGRHYEDHPPSRVRFVPDTTTPAPGGGEPPPF